MLIILLSILSSLVTVPLVHDLRNMFYKQLNFPPTLIRPLFTYFYCFFAWFFAKFSVSTIFDRFSHTSRRYSCTTRKLDSRCTKSGNSVGGRLHILVTYINDISKHLSGFGLISTFLPCSRLKVEVGPYKT